MQTVSELENKRLIIAVIGAKGFVGRAICREIDTRPNLKSVPIIRGDDIGFLSTNAQIIIHAANPAKRFQAENNPRKDFEETVLKTFNITQICCNKKIILVSSISARTQLDKHYGKHRRACEVLVENTKNLIIRLGPMYGSERKEDTIHDLINNKKIYLCGSTKYAYISVEYAAKKIIDSLNLNGLREIGARNSISLQEIKSKLNSKSIFEGFVDNQVPIDPFEDAPFAEEIFEFCKLEKNG